MMMVALVAGAVGVIGALGGFGARAEQSAQEKPVVEKLVLNDTIQPVSAGELKRAIEKAKADGAEVLLVELNTPGGLLDSTREMVGAMLSSRVPVVVYVAPSGARAGSAGFFLLEAADVSVMAQGTR
jgi:membrane-bound serine protease (ClpP class)